MDIKDVEHLNKQINDLIVTIRLNSVRKNDKQISGRNKDEIPFYKTKSQINDNIEQIEKNIEQIKLLKQCLKKAYRHRSKMKCQTTYEKAIAQLTTN